MRKLAACLCLAVLAPAAHANLVTIEWFGTVNGAHSNIHAPGAWYEIGDAISGTFTINTQLGPGDPYFVTSNRPQYEQSGDLVRVYDDEIRDSVSVLDYEIREYGAPGAPDRLVLSEYATISFASTIDFLNGSGLEQSFDVSQLSWGTGEMLSQAWWQVDYEHVYPRESYVHFYLDRVVARVPEPATLPLLASGVLAIFLARRRRTARPVT
jgi:hypothetical protein